LRFSVSNPWGGVIRTLRDVVVQRTGPYECVAIAHAPGVVGETLRLDLLGGGQVLALDVRVIESRPVIVDGTVRHRVRLAVPTRIPEVSGDDGQADVTAEGPDAAEAI
jgi:hypothetical protein